MDQNKTPIIMGCDHAAYQLKEKIKPISLTRALQSKMWEHIAKNRLIIPTSVSRWPHRCPPGVINGEF